MDTKKNLHFTPSFDFILLNDHSSSCLYGIDHELLRRYRTAWKGLNEDILNPYLTYTAVSHDDNNDGISEMPYVGNMSSASRPVVVNEAIHYMHNCVRDDKIGLVKEGMERQVCNCITQIYVTIAVYRLWKCTALLSSEEKDNKGNNNIIQNREDYGFWLNSGQNWRNKTNTCEWEESGKFFSLLLMKKKEIHNNLL